MIRKGPGAEKCVFYLRLLIKSGFYGIEHYHETMKLKDVLNANGVKYITDRLKDINNLTLDEILATESGIFDEVRLRIIIERINRIGDKPTRNKYICCLQLKIMYMIAKGQIDATYQKLFPKLILEGFYGYKF